MIDLTKLQTAKFTDMRGNTTIFYLEKKTNWLIKTYVKSFKNKKVELYEINFDLKNISLILRKFSGGRFIKVKNNTYNLRSLPSYTYDNLKYNYFVESIERIVDLLSTPENKDFIRFIFTDVFVFRFFAEEKNYYQGNTVIRIGDNLLWVVNNPSIENFFNEIKKMITINPRDRIDDGASHQMVEYYFRRIAELNSKYGLEENEVRRYPAKKIFHNKQLTKYLSDIASGRYDLFSTKKILKLKIPPVNDNRTVIILRRVFRYLNKDLDRETYYEHRSKILYEMVRYLNKIENVKRLFMNKNKHLLVMHNDICKLYQLSEVYQGGLERDDLSHEFMLNERALVEYYFKHNLQNDQEKYGQYKDFIHMKKEILGPNFTIENKYTKTKNNKNRHLRINLYPEDIVIAHREILENYRAFNDMSSEYCKNNVREFLDKEGYHGDTIYEQVKDLKDRNYELFREYVDNTKRSGLVGSGWKYFRFVLRVLDGYEYTEEVMDDLFVSLYHAAINNKPSSDYVYSIVRPTSPEDVIREGNDLDHCVGSYIDRIIQKESNIVFLRRTDDLDTSLVTVEILTDEFGKHHINQVYGYKDSYLKPNEKPIIALFEHALNCGFDFSNYFGDAYQRHFEKYKSVKKAYKKLKLSKELSDEEKVERIKQLL